MSNNTYIFTINPENSSIRVDKFLLNELTKLNIVISRSNLKKLIENGALTTQNNQKITSCSYLTKDQEQLTINLSENIDPEGQPLIAKDIDFEIVFDDEHLAVINKPAGLTTHPGAGNYQDTLANALLYKFKDQLSDHNGNQRPGIVHRLDRDTSGLMVIAKNNQSHMLLSKAIEQKQIIRKYLTYIYGHLTPPSGKIDKPISRSRVNRLKMTTSRMGIKSRNATTLYNTLEVFHDGFASLIECQLLTGRTHQIRVHLESLKHSIIGDQLYNSCKKHPPSNFTDQSKLNLIQNFPRQALHSYYIEFTHPITNQHLKFEQKPPTDMQELEKSLR